MRVLVQTISTSVWQFFFLLLLGAKHYFRQSCHRNLKPLGNTSGQRFKMYYCCPGKRKKKKYRVRRSSTTPTENMWTYNSDENCQDVLSIDILKSSTSFKSTMYICTILWVIVLVWRGKKGTDVKAVEIGFVKTQDCVPSRTEKVRFNSSLPARKAPKCVGHLFGGCSRSSCLLPSFHVWPNPPPSNGRKGESTSVSGLYTHLSLTHTHTHLFSKNESERKKK